MARNGVTSGYNLIAQLSSKVVVGSDETGAGWTLM